MKTDVVANKLEKLENSMSIFQKEMINFKKEMMDFKKEMLGFKVTTTQSLLNIENTLKFYGDMYQVNRDGITGLDNRVTNVENILKIN